MNSSSHQLWNGTKYFLFFFYFSAVYQTLCFLFNVSGFVGLRESFYMTFLWLIPLLLLTHFAKSISAILGLILWMASLFSLGYFMLYHQEFSQSVLFIIFESNATESSEFLQTYFSWWMLPTIILYSVIPYFIWKNLEPIQITLKPKWFILFFSCLISTQSFTQIYFFENQNLKKATNKQLTAMQSSSPWNLIAGYIKYKQDLFEMEELLSKNSTLPALNNMKTTNQSDTLVLVIGESTNKNRMSLYGYNRDTTPLLEARKDDLIVFDNVFSPRPYTIEVLQQALTFADEENPDLYLSKPNLLNIMKQAGYTTYWITNQQTQTTRNTMLTTFSQIADYQIYLNNNRRQNSSSYDEVILEPFKQIMANNTQKKFIVLHLLGAHARYDYRYPESFAKFDNAVPLRNLGEKEQDYYNAYDNAILYNDYVVSSIMDIVQKNQNPSAMLYLSDHGEEVYDNVHYNKMGRNEAEPTLAMYSIPFMLYANTKWNNIFDIKRFEKYRHRSYSSSNLLHTYCDLAGIRFDGFNEQKSIINENYESFPILIGDPNKKQTLRDLRNKPLS